MSEQTIVRRIQVLLLLFAGLSTLLAVSITGGAVFRLTDSVNVPERLLTVLSTSISILLVIIYYKQATMLQKQREIKETHTDFILEISNGDSKIAINTKDSKLSQDLQEIVSSYEQAEIIERRETTEGIEFVLRKEGGD